MNNEESVVTAGWRGRPIRQSLEMTNGAGTADSGPRAAGTASPGTAPLGLPLGPQTQRMEPSWARGPAPGLRSII